MEILPKILISIVALEHIYILWMEMFAWETKGKEVFKAALPPEMFKPRKVWQQIKVCTTAFWLLVSFGLSSSVTRSGKIILRYFSWDV